MCILDHQVENVTSLGSELNFFFYTSLFPAVRRPNLKSFLSCYYTTYENIMKQAGLTREVHWRRAWKRNPEKLHDGFDVFSYGGTSNVD